MKQKNIFFLILLAASIFLLGTIIYNSLNEKKSINDKISTPESIITLPNYSDKVPEITPELQLQSEMTLEELRLHNIEENCFIGYKGKVYDITNFLNKHQGGKKVLLNLCGKASEFEDAFKDQHGTSKVETLLKEARYVADLKMI